MSKLLIILANIFLGIARSVGIIPFSYNFQRREAKTSTFWRYFSIVILFVIVVATPSVINILHNRMPFLNQQPLLSFVGFNRFVVLHLCAMFTVSIQLLNDQKVIYCCNETIRIYDSLRSFPSDVDGMMLDRSFPLRLMAKLVTLYPITNMIIFYITHDRAVQHPSFFLSLVLVFYCQMMLIMTCNTYYGAALLLSTFINHLNRSLTMVFKDIRLLKRQPGRANSLKMQKYCEFADVVDMIMNFHRKIVALGRIINQQFQVQIICFFLYVSVECVVQSYILYFITTDLKEKGDHRTKLHLGAISYILAWLVDLVLVIGAADRLGKLFAETKWIVRIGKEVGSVDERLERMLEQFSIYLNDEKVAFTACGMFDVDNRCLFMMCQRFLTSMLILMQFDLILRYKK